MKKIEKQIILKEMHLVIQWFYKDKYLRTVVALECQCAKGELHSTDINI